MSIRTQIDCCVQEVTTGEGQITATLRFGKDFLGFQGHFPEKPVMPGVLIVEALAQTAATMAMDILLTEDESAYVYLTALDNVKFRQQVVPGDVIELHVTKDRARSSLWRLSGEARVEGKVVAQAGLSAVI